MPILNRFNADDTLFFSHLRCRYKRCRPVRRTHHFILRSALRNGWRCSMCQYGVPAIRAGASVLFATHGIFATIWYATTIDALDHSHVLQTHSPAGAARRRHSTFGPLKKRTVRSRNAHLFLHLFERHAFGFRIDKKHHKKLQDHHQGEEDKRVSSGGRRE
jgi:hypothetical protein